MAFWFKKEKLLTTMAFASSGSGSVRVNDNTVMTQAVVGATRSGNYKF